MYPIITGPVAWLAFGIFFIGCVLRGVQYVRGLHWQADRVAYREHYQHGIKGALRSIFFWLLPFGTRSWRVNARFTVIFFAFHIGLIVTPVFLQAHHIILKQRWGFGFWTISDATADILTMVTITAAGLIILRRLALPEVRILTTAYDYLVLLIAVAPFITGFFAYHQVAGPRFWMIAHILSGEIMLVAIPFTKLSHFVLFFMSRAQLGMDYGIKRGGMKGKGLAW